MGYVVGKESPSAVSEDSGFGQGDVLPGCVSIVREQQDLSSFAVILLNMDGITFRAH